MRSAYADRQRGSARAALMLAETAAVAGLWDLAGHHALEATEHLAGLEDSKSRDLRYRCLAYRGDVPALTWEHHRQRAQVTHWARLAEGGSVVANREMHRHNDLANALAMRLMELREAGA